MNPHRTVSALIFFAIRSPFTWISVVLEGRREAYCALNWATAHFEPVHGSWELHCGRLPACECEAGAYDSSPTAIALARVGASHPFARARRVEAVARKAGDSVRG